MGAERHAGLAVIAAVAALAVTTVPALADRIDGDWCSSDGKHLSIDGPFIVIPSGAEITGAYDRHGFSYVAPDGDPEAGQSIDMRQISDAEMWLRRTVGSETGEVEIWRRCQVTS